MFVRFFIGKAFDDLACGQVMTGAIWSRSSRSGKDGQSDQPNGMVRCVEQWLCVLGFLSCLVRVVTAYERVMCRGIAVVCDGQRIEAKHYEQT